jgi:hypothetical protein
VVCAAWKWNGLPDAARSRRQLVWGERELDFDFAAREAPGWLRKTIQAHKVVRRRVATLTELTARGRKKRGARDGLGQDSPNL